MITTDNGPWIYTASGSNATFAYSNKIFEETDLLVYLNDVLQSASAYDVTGVGSDAGGSVIFTSNPTAGTIVRITSAVPATQTLEPLDNGQFPAQNVEDGLDRAMRVLQQQDTTLERTIRASVASGDSFDELPGGLDEFKGKVIYGDPSTGQPTFALPTTSVVQQASTSTAGIAELATNAETQAGSDATRTVTPAGLASVTATETRAGLVELATTAEAAAGTDTVRAVTAAGVAAAISGGASLGWKPLARFAPTAAATFLISGASYFASTYSKLRLHLIGLQPATDNDDLRLRITQGGVVKSGATDYDWQYKLLSNASSTEGTLADGQDAEIEMFTDVGNATGEHVSGTLEIEQAAAGAMYKFINWHLVGYNGSQIMIRAHGEGNYRADGNAIDGLQFSWMSGGNFQAIGEAFLEGLKTS